MVLFAKVMKNQLFIDKTFDYKKKKFKFGSDL
jgi:hypothetical protein